MNERGIFTKDDVLNNVKWFNSKNLHQYGKTDADLTITKHSNGYGLIFRNGSEKKLGDKFGRVEFGFIRPGILAFRSSPKGYQFNKKGKGSKYIALRNRKGESTFDELNKYLGDYDLECDNTFGLCYINLANRK